MLRLSGKRKLISDETVYEISFHSPEITLKDLEVDLQENKLVLSYNGERVLEKILSDEFRDSSVKAKFYKKKQLLAVTLNKN